MLLYSNKTPIRKKKTSDYNFESSCICFKLVLLSTSPFAHIIVCFPSGSGFDYNSSNALIPTLSLSTENELNSICIFSSGPAMTTVPSTANTMAVATLIQWPQVEMRKKCKTGPNPKTFFKGFPGGAGGGFPTKGSDYPGGAASSYYNTYASFYSQTGAPYR